ncbi:hypothetical protein COU56_03820 [Candidatus Pacearchaeota archaeon CG10_big_fil_rev_8_21_14_0_10_31_9]|nr:MAG: hypothetical protein COU56_03820 [Candidatus Pacearchaeota archaeon CG10_big_fil_rev_8_21_14_0_10_31_9]PIZ83719.1 MAG: hypothetical protein COX97_00670 [Candidatus Pacearchaeota archaeon CG_4_10_14_0_2_um_filter_05_32_18]
MEIKKGLGEGRIDNVSRELLLEAVRTVPITPKYSEIVLAADGILSPQGKSESELKYIAECRDHGVMPFSNLRFEYKYNHDLNKSIFIPNYDGIFSPGILGISPKSGSFDEVIQGLIDGGRFHNIHFENGFVKFRDEFLQGLLEKRYEINSGDLTLATYSLTGYNEGEYTDTTIKFGGFTSGFKLHIGHELPGGKTEELSSWFGGLYDKYQLKQERFKEVD